MEPLEARLVLDSVVVFNEIMYNPAGAPAGTPEWIELHNQMAVDVDLSGWSIRSGAKFTFPEGTIISGGGYLVVSTDPVALAAVSNCTNALGPLNGQLANQGERIELVSNGDRVMDVLDYQDGGQWPVAADGSGATLAKADPDSASRPAENWRSSQQVGGTPGAVNFPTGPLLGPATTRLAIGATWWYDDTGTDRGTAWRATDYSPSANGWKQGGALLYDETAALPAPKTTPLTSGRNAYYFRTSFSFDGNPSATQLTLNCVIDDGAVFYLNGSELYRLNMPGGTISYGTNALQAVENAQYSQPILLSGSGLVSGDNVLAVEVHQAATTPTPSLTLLQTGGDNGSGGVPDNLALQSHGSTAFAKDTIPGYPDRHTIPGLNDGVYGNMNSWIGNSSPTFAGVRFSAAQSIAKIAWGRDNTGTYADRYPGTYTVQYTTVANPGASTPDASWNTIGSVTYTGSYPDATPARRHVWGFPAVSGATGVRIRFSDGATCIDELEVYSPDAPDAVFGAAVESAPILNAPPPLQLNEIAASTATFWLEIRNTGTAATSTAGVVVATESGRRYAVPPQTIAAGDLLLLDDAALRFAPVYGERVFLYAGDGSTVLDAVRVRDHVHARSTEYSGEWLHPDAPTPDSPNTFALEHDVVINEIMYHPFESTAGVDATGEWIELYNRGSGLVDLSGWKLESAVDFVFPPGTTLASNAYLVVAQNSAALAAQFPGITVAGNFSGQLADDDELIRLVDQRGNPADEVHYYDGGRWPGYADGGGSSLELRDPDADNSQPEAWAASDETPRTGWQTYTYQGTAVADGWSEQWHEFILGLLDGGEVLLDDISVVEKPGVTNKQLIQNGSFQSDTIGAAPAKWRVLGNHSGTVVLDPDNSSNKVLRLIATGPMEDRGNHAETTFVGNVAITNGWQYQISFKARWLHGSNLLTTRMYTDRLPKTHVLSVPALHGTPGGPNSTVAANLGPTYRDLAHTPVVPAPGQNITVTVTAADPDGIGPMKLWYAVNSAAAQSVTMSSLGGGRYQGTIPGQAASAVVQFYVQGTDGLDAASYFPADGPKSRALVKVQDNQAHDGLAYNFRIIMTPADLQAMETPVNQMSNGVWGATVVYKEGEVYYDVGAGLSGSNAGRGTSTYRNFRAKFDPMQPFRGVQTDVTLDRSGRGALVPNGQDEIVIKHVFNRAGGPGEYDDIIYAILPDPAESRSALLLLDPYGNEYLDEQSDNGADGLLYKLRVQYIANGTVDGNPESLKVPNPYNHTYPNNPGRDLADYGNDKETYRFHLQLQNNQAQDDFSRIIELSKAMSSLSGAALKEATDRMMDVDEVMRELAVLALSGVTDVYTRSWYHNAYFYVRPDDGRVLLLPQDWDNSTFGDSTSASPVPPVSCMNKLTNLPGNLRLFQGHLQNIVNTTFNATYLTRWLTHYGAVAGQNFSPILNYVNARRSFVLSSLPAQVAFAITTNSGANFSTNNTTVTLAGTGWINIHDIRLAGQSAPLPVTWTDGSHWQVTLPLVNGPNVFSFQAYDFQGIPISTATDSITVTSSANPTALQQYLRITELNYHPTAPTASEQNLGYTDGDDFEFAELTNISTSTALDLHGVKLTTGVTFDFETPGAVKSIAPGGRILLVRNLNAFKARYGDELSPQIAGVYAGKLDNNGERLVMVDGSGLALADFTYGATGLWPGRADGNGSSLEVINTAGNYSDPDNWQSSQDYNGSPGSAGTVADVVVSEVLAHSDQPLVDAIELYNTTNSPIDIGGWWLSDTSADYFKFLVPAGTVIAAHGYLVLYEGHWVDNQLQYATNAGGEYVEFGGGPKGFGLNGAHGDDVWLVQADTSGNLTRFADHAEFGAMASGESYGRWQDDQGRWRLYPMLRRTLDAPNNANSTDGNGPRVGPLLLGEVMYSPKPLVATETAAGFTDLEDMEFIEICNPTSAAVDLIHWRLDKGVTFEFAAGTTLAPGAALIVVPFMPSNAPMLAAFRARYGNTTATVVGPYVGHLSGTGDKLRLQRPDDPPVDEPGWYPPLLEDEIVYGLNSGAGSADGKSLHRIAVDAWGDNKASCGVATASPGVVKLVAGRHVVYSNSAFDGRTSGGDVKDDGAMAPDKEPLLPGRQATFTNYTSYSRGTNGIMLDLVGAGTTFSASDFEFRVGNSSADPAAWPLVAATPTFWARSGAGVLGSTRVEIIWPDNAIQNQWLRVKVLANSHTGLAGPDVFYFGNSVGETGNHRSPSGADAAVDASDVSGVRANSTSSMPASMLSLYDFNRDRRINATDELIAAARVREGGDPLQLLDLTGARPSGAQAAMTAAAAIATAMAEEEAESTQYGVRNTQFTTASVPCSAVVAGGVAVLVSHGSSRTVSPEDEAPSPSLRPTAAPFTPVLVGQRNPTPTAPPRLPAAVSARATAHDTVLAARGGLARPAADGATAWQWLSEHWQGRKRSRFSEPARVITLAPEV